MESHCCILPGFNSPSPMEDLVGGTQTENLDLDARNICCLLLLHNCTLATGTKSNKRDEQRSETELPLYCFPRLQIELCRDVLVLVWQVQCRVNRFYSCIEPIHRFLENRRR